MKMMNNIKVNDQLIINEPIEDEEEEEIIITSNYLFLIYILIIWLISISPSKMMVYISV